jgi:hypothetical protein
MHLGCGIRLRHGTNFNPKLKQDEQQHKRNTTCHWDNGSNHSNWTSLWSTIGKKFLHIKHLLT